MNPLHDVFEYRDGGLYWKVGHKTKGKRFGACRPDLYRRGMWNGCFYYEHRLIWEYFHGVKPLNYIDHIDGNQQNNSISNLREATHSENCANAKKYKNNKTGHKGVFWDQSRNSYRVEVAFNKQKIVRREKDFELACLISDEARSLLHGNYAKY